LGESNSLGRHVFPHFDLSWFTGISLGCAGGEQCGQQVAQYWPGALMGVYNTGGVAPQETHSRTFGRTRIQLRGPRGAESALVLAFVIFIDGFLQ
jgi:hypothetical protein